MMSDGFITGCKHGTEEPNVDPIESNLRVCDFRVDEADIDDMMVAEIFITETAHTIGLNLFEAKQLQEALTEIISRYEPEGTK